MHKLDSPDRPLMVAGKASANVRFGWKADARWLGSETGWMVNFGVASLQRAGSKAIARLKVRSLLTMNISSVFNHQS